MADKLDPQIQLHLKKCREALHADFGKLFARDRIDSVFDDSVAQTRGDGHFEDYLPALAEKLTRERLGRAGGAHRGVASVTTSERAPN